MKKYPDIVKLRGFKCPLIPTCNLCVLPHITFNNLFRLTQVQWPANEDLSCTSVFFAFINVKWPLLDYLEGETRTFPPLCRKGLSLTALERRRPDGVVLDGCYDTLLTHP